MNGLDINPGDKLTVIGVSPAMAMTTSIEAVIVEVAPDGEGLSLQCKLRGKIKKMGIRWSSLKESLIIKGWDVPFETDIEYSGKHGGSFRGNACINLIGTPADIRGFIDQKNINPSARLGTVIAIEGDKETLVYPEMDERHSVVEGMKRAAYQPNLKGEDKYV